MTSLAEKNLKDAFIGTANLKDLNEAIKKNHIDSKKNNNYFTGYMNTLIGPLLTKNLIYDTTQYHKYR
ncbi:hypothetical protein DSUL_100200 [Desulfovibrionales bacterium]